jgi:hypothetical protein
MYIHGGFHGAGFENLPRHCLTADHDSCHIVDIVEFVSGKADELRDCVPHGW